MISKASAFAGRRRRRAAAGLTALALFSGVIGAAMTQAAVTSPGNGAIVRDDVMPITENRGGKYLTFAAAFGCSGSSGPQTIIKIVRDADNATVATLTRLGTGPYNTSWATVGAQPGGYTIKTVDVDVTKTSSGPCTPVNVPQPDVHFTYRPWQHQFKDVLGTGAVKMNTNPAEFRIDVDGLSSPIVLAPSTAIKFYSLNAAVHVTMPADPGACAGDPLGCLPAQALQCNPAAGCVPRLGLVNYANGGNELVGLFDFSSHAFAAKAKTGGHTRVLFSGGPGVDDLIHKLQGMLTGLAQQAGIDLPTLLAEKVRIKVPHSDGTVTTTTISLLEGLGIAEAAGSGSGGIDLVGPWSVGAGEIIHVGLELKARGAVTPYGYKEQVATVLPKMPTLPAPLGTLVPGTKLKRITGKFDPALASVAATLGVPLGHSPALAVTTDPNEPNGLPAWIPLVSQGALVIPDTGIDFLGYGASTSTELFCLLGQCLYLDIMAGAGVAVFGDNPLSAAFGKLPLIFDNNPALAGVMSTVDNAVGSVITNPAVTGLVGLLTAPLSPVLAPILGGTTAP